MKPRDSILRNTQLIGLDQFIATQLATAGVDAAKGLFSRKAKRVKARLQQVIMNLLNNAIKFTNKGSFELVLEVTALTDEVVELNFFVIDSGIGISHAQQQTLFEAFKQADNSITRKFGGTGLGLIITNQLLKLMGGNLQVTSEPGVGSIFRFSLQLPLIEISQRKINPDNAPGLQGSSSGKILLGESLAFKLPEFYRFFLPFYTANS